MKQSFRMHSMISIDLNKILNGQAFTLKVQKNFLLMHPSTMKRLNCVRGELIVLESEKGQLLFHCGPYSSVPSDSVMIPSLDMFFENINGSIVIGHYDMLIDTADIIILCSEQYKPFMDLMQFNRFLQNELDHFYLREGLILNLLYNGFKCCFTVKKINDSTPDNEENATDLDEICNNVSYLDVSENNSSMEESNQSIVLCSTPIASKAFIMSKSILSNRMNVDVPEIKFKGQLKQFYMVHSKTNIQIEFLNVPNPLSTQISLSDIVGLKEQAMEMKACIGSLLDRSRNHAYGAILVGLSGTGKSSLVQAIANEFHLPIFNLNSVAVGRNEADLKFELQRLFKEVTYRSPSVLFLDNIDKFSSNLNVPSSKRNTMTSFLSAMIYNLMKSERNVIVIGTTQNLLEVDASLRKSGTLEKEIFFDIPSVDDRKEILYKILDEKHHSLSDEQLTEISNATHGFTGGDIKFLCDKATVTSFQKTENSCITFEVLKDTLKIVKPSSVSGFKLEVPNVRWSDIGGMQQVKDAITEMVDWPLKHAEQFKKFSITPARGILLYGPPGCSKTMIAKALVSESHLNFISIKGSQLFSKYVGESEKSVSELFKKARSAAPCVLFFDEMDSLAAVRGSTSGNSNVAEKVLTQLLIEIDGVDVLQGVSIIAATNRPDMIDPSFLRPGRFDQMIYVSLPNVATRKEIFEVKLKNMPISTDVDKGYLIQATEGYTGAEIIDICREAAMSVIKDYITSPTSIVTMSHFLSALQFVQPRTSKKMIDFYEMYNKKST